MKMQQGNQVDAYLAELKRSLELNDQYLWTTRNDSTCFGLTNGTMKANNCPPQPSARAVNQHKLLFSCGIGDSGEDGSTRFCRTLRTDPATHKQAWTNCTGVFLSMDVAGYSVDLRRSLARISALQGNTTAQRHWAAKAEEVVEAARAALWRPELSAMYDRYEDDTWVTSLQHNNLRMMWLGAFDQGMADAFVRDNLMNTSRFWTKMPMPSIAVSDPHFEDEGGNNWSGPPEGLTLQRAVRALEAYGHHAESVLAGVALTNALLSAPGCATNSSRCGFPQQIDPFTATPDSGDGYGPMILSLLEYTGRRVGVVPEPAGLGGRLLWSAAYAEAASATGTNFTQRLGNALYIFESAAEQGRVVATASKASAAAGRSSSSSNRTELFTVSSRSIGSMHTAAGRGRGSSSSSTATKATFAGVRVVTAHSIAGSEASGSGAPAVMRVVGIADVTQAVQLSIGGQSTAPFHVEPNEVWAITRNGTGLTATLESATPFFPPHA